MEYALLALVIIALLFAFVWRSLDNSELRAKLAELQEKYDQLKAENEG